MPFEAKVKLNFMRQLIERRPCSSVHMYGKHIHRTENIVLSARNIIRILRIVHLMKNIALMKDLKYQVSREKTFRPFISCRLIIKAHIIRDRSVLFFPRPLVASGDVKTQVRSTLTVLNLKNQFFKKQKIEGLVMMQNKR